LEHLDDDDEFEHYWINQFITWGFDMINYQGTGRPASWRGEGTSAETRRKKSLVMMGNTHGFQMGNKCASKQK